MTPAEVWAVAAKSPAVTVVKACFSPGEGPQDLVDLLEAARRNDAALWNFVIQIKGQEVWIVRKGNLPEVRLDGAFKPLEDE